MSLPEFSFFDDVPLALAPCTSGMQETQETKDTTSVTDTTQRLSATLTPSLIAPALPSAIDPLNSILSAPNFTLPQDATTVSLPSSSEVTTSSTSSASIVLERALSMPNRASWCRDFLFADAPSVDLAMLTPQSLDAAICANIVQTSMEVSGAHGGMIDSNVAVQWAIIPSFCVGDITCGITVSSQQISPTTASTTAVGEDKPQPREFTYGRFLRNERTSEFLLYRAEPVTPNQNVPITSLLHMTLRKSTARERTFMRFRDAPRGRRPDASHVEFMSVSTDSRFCPACNSGPSAGCDCRLSSRSPSHPHDFHWSTMANHCGDFNGHAVSTILRGPRSPTVAHMITRCAVRGGNDKAVIAALTNWAIENRMAAMGPAPSFNFIPPTSMMLNVGENPSKVLDEAAQGLRLFCGPKSPMIKPAILTTSDASTSAGQYVGYVQGGGGVMSRVSFGADSEEAEKAARKHRRKLRNRMAAARSNLRRKENYLNLQRDVNDIRTRRKQLELRLEELRVENVRLRAQTESDE